MIKKISRKKINARMAKGKQIELLPAPGEGRRLIMKKIIWSTDYAWIHYDDVSTKWWVRIYEYLKSLL